MTNSFNHTGTTPHTVNADALANHGDPLFGAVIQSNAASISKKRRRAWRVPLQPKPSVPNAINLCIMG